MTTRLTTVAIILAPIIDMFCYEVKTKTKKTTKVLLALGSMTWDLVWPFSQTNDSGSLFEDRPSLNPSALETTTFGIKILQENWEMGS